MKRLLFTFAIACALIPLNAQETLTLNQCLRMGIENNLQLQTKRNDIVKGEHAITENRAKLLPQINAVVSMNDNFNPPVSVTDGSAYGNPYNVTKTLQYNASAGLQLQMPLYNQTLLTALDITKLMDRINRLGYDKARNDLIEQITKMYYLAQSTAEQIAIVRSNIGRMEELKNITTAFFDNGMAMEVDVKRVNINLENLQVQLDNAEAMLVQQINMLKYVIDYPADKDMVLTPVDASNVEAGRSSRRWFSRVICRRSRSRATSATLPTPTNWATGSTRDHQTTGTTRQDWVLRCASRCSTDWRNAPRYARPSSTPRTHALPTTTHLKGCARST